MPIQCSFVFCGQLYVPPETDQQTVQDASSELLAAASDAGLVDAHLELEQPETTWAEGQVLEVRLSGWVQGDTETSSLARHQQVQQAVDTSFDQQLEDHGVYPEPGGSTEPPVLQPLALS